MALILLHPWNSQPKGLVGVDHDNPLCQGMVLAWNGANQPLFNLIGIGSTTRTGAGIFVAAGNQLGFDANAAGSLSFTNIPAPPGNAVTIFRAFTFVSKAAFTNSKVQYGVPFGASLSANVYLSGSNILSEAGGVTVSADLGINKGFVVYPGSGATSLFHFNNSADASVTTSGTYAGAQTVRIGANLNDPAAGYTSGCVTHCLFIWNRALSRAERERISENPWQLFEPQRIPIYIATAGGTSFNPAWAIRNARTIGAGVI